MFGLRPATYVQQTQWPTCITAACLYAPDSSVTTRAALPQSCALVAEKPSRPRTALRRLEPAKIQLPGGMTGASEVPVARVPKNGGLTAVNAAMASLRQLIPTEPRDRRLSKLETLKLATRYIDHLAIRVSQQREGRTWVSCASLCVFCEAERRSACYAAAAATHRAAQPVSA